MFTLKFLRCQARIFNKRPIVYKQFYSKAKFKDGGEHATFNDMPVPKGDWQEDYVRKQRRYMLYLLSGFASFVASVVFVAKSGKMVFNYTIPDYPHDENDAKREEKKEEAFES